MKRIITIGLVLLLSATSLTGKAQSAFEKGKSYVSLGYAAQLIPIKAIFKVYADELGFSVKGLGPVVVKYEYGISEKVGIGFNIGYTSGNIQWTAPDSLGGGGTYNYQYKYSKLTATPRFNYHFGDNKMIDPYLGMGIGFKRAQYNLTTNDPFFQGLSISGIPVSFEATFGLRVLFTEQIGGFAEIGAGHGFFQFGAVGKF